MADETTPKAAAAPQPARKRAAPRRSPAKAAAAAAKPAETVTEAVTAAEPAVVAAAVTSPEPAVVAEAVAAPKAADKPVAAPKIAAAAKAPAASVTRHKDESVLDTTVKEATAVAQARFGDFFTMMLDSIELARATQAAAFEATRGMAALQTDFVRARIDAQARLSKKVSGTKDIQAIVTAQREYAESAVAAWTDHAAVVNERCQKLMGEGIDPITRTWQEAAVHMRDVGF